MHLLNDDKETLVNYRKTLSEIQKLRSDYITLGGTDPDFLLNLNNLEAFYETHRISPTNDAIIEASKFDNERKLTN